MLNTNKKIDFSQPIEPINISGDNMIKKLTRHGNSNALLLDKALLQVLNISQDTELKITTDGKSITITPLMAKVSDHEKTQKSFEVIMDKYDDTFRYLSDN